MVGVERLGRGGSQGGGCHLADVRAEERFFKRLRLHGQALFQRVGAGHRKGARLPVIVCDPS